MSFKMKILKDLRGCKWKSVNHEKNSTATINEGFQWNWNIWKELVEIGIALHRLKTDPKMAGRRREKEYVGFCTVCVFSSLQDICSSSAITTINSPLLRKIIMSTLPDSGNVTSGLSPTYHNVNRRCWMSSLQEDQRCDSMSAPVHPYLTNYYDNQVTN